MIPVVIEQTSRGERSYDIYSRLLKDTYHVDWTSREQYSKFSHRPVLFLNYLRWYKDIAFM